jgi:hypothetical protein
MKDQLEDDDESDMDQHPDSISRDLACAMIATWQKVRSSDFADVVREYKLVEEEFIRRAADNNVDAGETKRRVAEAIFKTGVATRQPFDVCQKWWDELRKVGFTNIDRTCTMSWFYGDCCLCNMQSAAGIAVIEPLIAEVERLLAEPTVTEAAAEYYRYEIDNLGKLREKLKAQQKMVEA